MIPQNMGLRERCSVNRMELSKRQVGAFLKIMGNDTLYPQYMGAYIDKLGNDVVLVTTNRHSVAILYTEIDEFYIGDIINRKSIETWYKLASGKQKFTSEVAQELANVAEKMPQIPDNIRENWSKIVPLGRGDLTEFQDNRTISFNAELGVQLQILDNVGYMQYTMNGKLKPLVAKSERGIYGLMPIIEGE